MQKPETAPVPAALRPLAILVHLALLAGVLATVAPFVWTLVSSFKENSEIFGFPLTFLPAQPTLDNYRRLLSGDELPYARQFLNSLLVAGGQTLLALFVSTLVGFAFAKYQFRFKRPLFVMVLATLTIPQQVTLVPLFLVINSFGLLDTYAAVILPAAANAFGVFFMRQSMLAIPGDLLDAARIDGSSEFGLYWRIGLPLARGSIAVLAVIEFLRSWNDYLWPLIVLRSAEMMTVPVGLATLVGLYKVEYGMVMAGSFLATVPIIVLFVIGRDHLVAGMTAGAVKG